MTEPDPNLASCRQCWFYKGAPQNAEGICRRNAPLTDWGNDQPRVPADYWCGEYRPRQSWLKQGEA